METVNNKIRQLIREEIDKVFLLQESFSSKQVDDAVDFIKNELIEFEDAVTDNNYKYETADKKAIILLDLYTLHVANKSLFFKDLILAIRFVKVKKEWPKAQEELKRDSRGMFIDELAILDDKKITKGKINIDYTFNEGEFDTKLLKALISHEVLHMYELYHRLLNGEKRFPDKYIIYSQFIKKILEKAKENNCYDFIEKLTRIIYCLFYFEKNAFVASLYGELLDCDIFNMEDARREFLETKTYSSYYEPLKNINEFLDINSINNETSEFIKNNINIIINETLKEYNNWNINNKITIQEVPFAYKREGIQDYINKIKKVAQKELIRFDKILPDILYRAIETRKGKLRGINERYFVFEIKNKWGFF